MTTMTASTVLRPRFEQVVHLEGMDLAGKSTATAGLAACYPEAALRHNSLVEGNSIYEFADELRRSGATSTDVLGPLYIAALAEDLRRLSVPEGVLIQDSTILLRSLAFNQIIGLDYVVGALTDLASRHPRFGVTIVLTATIDSRLRRLQRRRRFAPWEVASDDLLIERAPDRFVAMEAALVSYAEDLFDAIVLDTSELTPSEVLSAIQLRWTPLTSR